MTAAALTAMPTTEGLKRQIVDETILSPRFYTTDFAALDRLDVEPVRAEWDELLAVMEADPNRLHFRKKEPFTGIVETLPADVREEFVSFMVSSMTSEFSGCIFYSEIARRTTNPEIRRLMKLLTRDESRHAGFIRDSLKDAGLPISLSFLTKAKTYHYFRPKFILYATYLSEKIGYARYIVICRHLQRHPEHAFHPLFSRFEEWCNDEYRHGEAIALLIRADPRLTRGINRLWIRFFLISVYATMYCRDHMRPALHKAMGLDITDYDYRVFETCTAISRQVFPILLDTDSPRFRAGMEALRRASVRLEAARQQRGITRTLARTAAIAATAWAFLRLYVLPTKENPPPDRILAPAVW
ncbi:magnesium-protoporphyrin IX monomethyl ester (oxidative) cyclase [Sphingomonas sp. MMS24-J45]|uniref:magnesium-protoporphyrin IX monomethyl ester (oxidative) cyclase n=1 Tax=Sphingomonas sp. MMS24-J45 TaxID=3238806 RepID=UPI00384EC2D4